MKVRSPAKLNLFLHITGRREDGYHTLFSLMTLIGIHDDLNIDVSGRTITVTCDHPEVPDGSDNLAYRAAVLFFEAAAGQRRAQKSLKSGVTIHITKRIPVGGGLGGGSSNAAAVLMTLNRFCENVFSKPELMRLGKKLGADVPFFIHGGPAYAEGIGDILTDAPDLVPYRILVASPPMGASTSLVYKNVDFALTKQQKSNNKALLKLDGENRKLDVLGLLHNDLEEAACRVYPDIASVKNEMTEFLPEGILMTGSGSSFFAIFSETRKADQAFAVLKQRWEGTGKQVFLTSFT